MDDLIKKLNDFLIIDGYKGENYHTKNNYNKTGNISIGHNNNNYDCPNPYEPLSNF